MKDRDEGDGAVPIWPDMLNSFALFCDASWDNMPLGMGGSIRTNIKRSELEASARMLKITMTEHIFSDVRIMESEALTYWSAKR